MKLADFMHEHQIDPTHLRRLLGITNRSTVHRWIHGERVPRPDMMQKIIEITKGAVQLMDFLDQAPPKCAYVIVRNDGTVRWDLPWSRTSEEEIDDIHGLDDRDDSGWDGSGGSGGSVPVSPPIRRALAVLGKRAIGIIDGTYTVDGQRTDLPRLVRAANKELCAQGKSQIAYPGVDLEGGRDVK